MRLSYGTTVVTAGIAGIVSFGLLAAAIGTEYWYIIVVNRPNETDSEDLNSHSGLWRIYEGKDDISYNIYSFSADTSKYSETEKHLLGLHRVIVILLPLSLVLLVFGGILGLVSSLARSRTLLLGTAAYLLLCSLLTLSGVSIYVSYSQQALAELERELGPEELAHVGVSFGWSLVLACLSFCLEVLAGVLLLLAARLALLQRGPDFTAGLAWAGAPGPEQPPCLSYLPQPSLSVME
ncbi:transmembrane protein 235 [Paramormyrops kingsleyae]|uniref:transmembrane protein 235 n=1 Tax=Paramormyrops kingsleyae TaxID=1676925 RepID=UPI003B97ACD5